MKKAKEEDYSWVKEDTNCWLNVDEPERPYVAAIIIQEFDGIALVTDESREHKLEVPISCLLERSQDNSGPTVSDMIDMEILNEAELLGNLDSRWSNEHKIYTFVGPTLLVINPFQKFPQLQTPQKRREYADYIIGAGLNPLAYKELDPHVYSIAAEAYRSLVNNQQNQTIVISGESGAGKTENAKDCMKLLACIGELGGDSVTTKKGGIEDKILQCNPLLEAFGNAKTQRNYNSSRFGKYVFIGSENGKVLGATITNYLLEKSRITSPGQNERNYHIFYHLLSGASLQELQKLFLLDGTSRKTVEMFEFLKVSNCFTDQKLDDVALWGEVTQAFQALGLQEFFLPVFQIVSAILQMGNFIFDDSTLTNDTGCKITQPKLVIIISQLLGLTQDATVSMFTKKSTMFVGKLTESPLNRTECVNIVQIIARELYDKLFNWLVRKLNQTIAPEQESKGVGLLDIYGFEVFDLNTFEQLFINYTNEKLHQLYIQYVFKEEENLFISEGLEEYLTVVQFKDNRNIIELLEKGVFSILDDSTQVAGTDETFLNRLKKENQSHPQFEVNKIPSAPNFIIKHSARDVEYNVNGFRNKNKDDINKHILNTLSTSRKALISQIFQQELEARQKSQDKFLSLKIRREMNELMNLLGSCDVHFVRCIKPNELKRSDIFDSGSVLNQIRYLGVLETLKVRKESYPIRKKYDNFYKQYGEMTNNLPYQILLNKEVNLRELVIEMFTKYFPEFDDSLVLFGKTKVFMRQQVPMSIDKIYEKVMVRKNEAAKKLQKMWNHYICMKRFRQFCAQVRKIQAYFKSFLCRRKFLMLVKKSIFIQKVWKNILRKLRLKKARRSAIIIESYIKCYYAIEYKKLKEQAVRSIQKCYREILKRREEKLYFSLRQIVLSYFKRSWNFIQIIKAIIIQAHWRGALCRAKYQNETEQIKIAGFKIKVSQAVIAIQKAFRGWSVRNKVAHMRKAASYIQGYFRMRWLSELFLRVKNAAIIIQRRFKVYLIRTKEQRERMKQFLKVEELKYNSYVSQENQALQIQQNIIGEIDFYNEKGKMQLFSCVLDLESLVDCSESASWAPTYTRLLKQSLERQPIMTLSVGESNNYAVSAGGKIYGWGLNDHCQINGKQVNQLTYQNTLHPKKVVSGSRHAFLLTHEGKLFAIGDNNKGQCGIGNYYDIQNLTQVPIEHVKQIVVVNEQATAITNDGIIYTWPNNNKQNKPFELKSWSMFMKLTNIVQQTLTVHSITAGLDFFMILTNQGYIYGFGNNQHGVLGVSYRPNEPTLIENLQEKVIEVHSGLKHIIARTSLGRVYCWGWGQRGQLGTGNFKDTPLPTLIPINEKCLQIFASRTSSICLTESRKILWWGSNGTIKYQCTPVEKTLEFLFLLPQYYTPIRLLSTYSRTKSVIYATFAYTRNILTNNHKLKLNILKNLTTKWADQDCTTIEPPQCDNLMNYFTSTFNRKPVPKSSIKFQSHMQHQQIIKGIQQELFVDSDEQLLDSYVEFNNQNIENGSQKQTEQIPNKYIIHDDISNLENSDTNRPLPKQPQNTIIAESKENQQRIKQLRETKKKYIAILQKKDVQRTITEKEFVKIIHQSDLHDILMDID